MQFRDLGAQYLRLKDEIDANIKATIESGRYISGPFVKQLEGELAEYVGVTHCVTCANGTDALELVLRAWGIGAGDAVFVPAFTFMSTAEVVATVGAYPVFVDICEDTFNIDPVSLESAISNVEKEGRFAPRAIIPVDLFGQPADYDAILPIAKKHGLKVLEDGAQGFGGAIRGKCACSFGDASTTSFFPAKPLGCYGDGGAIFTDDDDLAALLRSLCVHGKGREKYENLRIGCNSRLDTIQAGILLPKFHALRDYEINEVNRVAASYSEKLKDAVLVPSVRQGFLSSWAQYTIMCEKEEVRDCLQARLKEQGIPAMVYYPRPLHLQQAFAACEHKVGDLPVAEAACKRVLSLPMHPYMSEVDVEKVTSIIVKALGQLR
jgi:dTDP-4-amino-4,6-dideoxygalactose transaminase